MRGFTLAVELTHRYQLSSANKKGQDDAIRPDPVEFPAHTRQLQSDSSFAALQPQANHRQARDHDAPRLGEGRRGKRAVVEIILAEVVRTDAVVQLPTRAC
jgi:hypothetical protein